MSRYILITAANNEEEFIERTISSVVSQTLRPQKWVIVDDASTDRTGEILAARTREHSFIEVLKTERCPGRDFRNKVRAFNLGLSRVEKLPSEFIGNLDADISFQPDYFEQIIREFERDECLGIAGGMIHSRMGEQYISQEVALDSVAGAVQLFRRKCFEDVGGYRALPYGGIDAAAEIAARMKGWNVRTFERLAVLEHRRTGSAGASPLLSRVKEGRRMYSLGYAPLFFLMRCIYRCSERPKVVGSGAAVFGYLRSMLSAEPIALPPETVQFLRQEQRQKLRRLFRIPEFS